MLEYHAEEHGVVEREDKLQIPALLWAFVFGLGAGESRPIATSRRSYTGSTTGYSQLVILPAAKHQCNPLAGIGRQYTYTIQSPTSGIDSTYRW